MSPRASFVALAVCATAAGLVLPRLSEQQREAAALAAFGAVATTVIAARVIGSRHP